MQVCSKCKVEKEDSEFGKRSKRKSGLHNQCKECVNSTRRTPEGREKRRIEQDTPAARARKKRYAQTNGKEKQKEYRNTKIGKERTINAQLMHHYGISIEEFDALLLAQDNKCAVCGSSDWGTKAGKPMRPSVDHCHLSKKVRGLLCRGCNLGIGHLQDSVDLLQNAIYYLLRNR